MGEHASRMVRLAIQALLDADAQFADSVVVMDDEIDRMNHVARGRADESNGGAAGDQPAGIERDHHCPRPGKRIADHATNISRDVIFWIRGADIRHQVSTAVD